MLSAAACGMRSTPRHSHLHRSSRQSRVDGFLLQLSLSFPSLPTKFFAVIVRSVKKGTIGAVICMSSGRTRLPARLGRRAQTELFYIEQSKEQ